MNTKEKFNVQIDKDYTIPVWVVRGKNEGKTLIVTAGVHGCEYVGMLASRELYNEIDPSTLSGNIIILPLLNREGFFGGHKQINPIDNKNLNREFTSNGNTITDKIVSYLKENIFNKGDFLMDLHGGDINEPMTPLVFIPTTASSFVNETAKEGAKYLPVNYRIKSTSVNGLYGSCAQSGTPAFLLEIGGVGEYSKEEIELCKNSIYGILSFLNIKEGKNINENQVESIESCYESAEKNGYWYPTIEENQNFKKDELLGTLKDIDDNIIKEYFAKFDGTVMYYTKSLGVLEGDNLIAYSRF
ncbi:MAG: succinylglutamate desuccinylase/aspartoacylase family protein [Peptostreptococcaceae bacterium]